MNSTIFKSSWVLATQWDNESLQYVLAEKQGAKLTLVAARSFADTGDADYISELLAAELKKHGARRPTVLVALARSKVDMFTLELPPATNDELASLVPLQAMQHAPEIGADAALDFLPLDDDPMASRNVLVVVPHPGVLDDTREVLQDAGLTPRHVSFRPIATLPLIRRHTTQVAGHALVVTLQGDEADILLVDGGQLRLTRSVRLPDRDDLLFMASLSSEIDRTEIAAPQSSSLADDSTSSDDLDVTAEEKIEHVYSFGGGDERAIWETLSEELASPVTQLDPFQYLPQRTKMSLRESGRFAPLVGLLHEYLAGSATLDFLHPRRPAQTPSVLRRYSVFAIAAIVLLGIAGYAVYDKRKMATAELDSLRGQLAQLEKMADKVERKQRIVAAINAWKADDVNWLDELRDMSLRFPGPADAVIERMTIGPAAGGGNAVGLQVRVRDPAIVSMMEANLRDEYHSIRSKRVSEVASEDDFGWQLDASILVSPRPPDTYRRFLTLEKPGD